MIRSLSPRLAAYAALAAAGFLGSLLLGRSEAVLLALPFALIAVVGLALASEPVVRVEGRLDRDRVLVGDEVELEVRIVATTAVAGLQLTPILAEGLSLRGGAASTHSLAAGEECIIRRSVVADGWGNFGLSGATIRARDRFGLFLFEQSVPANLTLRVYPRPEQLRSLLSSTLTRPQAGNRVSREGGDGLEPADIRQFVPGDHARHVNWRVSARRSELHVNRQHPERSADVVIFIDTFADLGTGRRTTLDLAVRGAASLTHHYLRSRDRVGLIGFGGVVRWVRPGQGMSQLYRLMDSLLDTRAVSSYAWKGIDLIPRGTLPPKAMLLALTPLLDPRAIATLHDVRGRGFEVAVIEIDPLTHAPSRGDERGELAHWLWRLERDVVRDRLRRAGIGIAGWDDRRPLEAALEEVRASRRPAARAPV